MKNELAWLECMRANLLRRQQELQSLLTMEQTRPKASEPKQMTAWVRLQQEVLDNLEHLTQDGIPLDQEKNKNLAKVSPEAQREIQIALGRLMVMGKLIIDLHRKNLDWMKAETEAKGQAVCETRRELSILQTLRQSLQPRARLGMLG